MNVSQIENNLHDVPLPSLERLSLAVSREMTARCLSKKTTDALIADIATRYGLTSEQLKGDRGPNPISIIRAAAYDLVHRERPHMSLPMIGRAFGGRDHTTVLSGIRKHRDRMAWADILIWLGSDQ